MRYSNVSFGITLAAAAALPAIALATCYEQIIRSCCAVVDSGPAPRLTGASVGQSCLVTGDCADFIIASPNVYQVQVGTAGKVGHQAAPGEFACKFYFVKCVDGKCVADTSTLIVSPCHDEVLRGAVCP